jgi:hypothetical protein
MSSVEHERLKLYMFMLYMHTLLKRSKMNGTHAVSRVHHRLFVSTTCHVEHLLLAIEYCRVSFNMNIVRFSIRCVIRRT